MTAWSVLLADDHRPTLEEVAAVLATDPRFEVVAAVLDAASAVEAARRTAPDICLLDVNMPGNGVRAAWEIAARLPSACVVMLTVSADDRDLLPALRAGARGYLLKDMDFARLPDTLADACAGGAAIPRVLVTRIVETLRAPDARRRALLCPTPLTAREWEVLDLLRRGLCTAQIARRLQLSNATVRSHVASATRKLGASDRDGALIAFAAQPAVEPQP